MAFHSFVPMELKSCVIKVTSYQHRVLSGVLCSPFFPGCVAFESYMELFRLLNGMFDEMRFPESAVQLRSFSEETAPSEPETCEEPMVLLASFRLEVHFRQNASWQGRLIWLDRHIEEDFRSVLELMTLIDSVLV